MSTEASGLSLLRLMQLVSPTLPIGAYAYSKGLEQAVEGGLVHDETSALDWIEGTCQHGVGCLDAPLLSRQIGAFRQDDFSAITRWNELASRGRETHELALEDRELGRALIRLLNQLQVPQLELLESLESPSYVTAFACACVRWDIPVTPAVHGFFHSVCEAQVAAAIKLVPLGQSAGQRCLSHCITQIPVWTRDALTRPDDEIGLFMPGFALCSAQHETQYARLFRS